MLNFVTFLSMANAGVFASCSRQLYLLEHHFNYIHKGWFRQVLFATKISLVFPVIVDSLIGLRNIIHNLWITCG